MTAIPGSISRTARSAIASFCACIDFMRYATLLSNTPDGCAVTPPRNFRTTP